MADVRIETLENGPNLVFGFGDAPIALCACGATKTQPYCDGSHKSVGFVRSGNTLPTPKAEEATSCCNSDCNCC